MNYKTAQHYLDITDKICPMTFVHTKLLIEKMLLGERAVVQLQGAEPLLNVPRAIRDHGHKIISLTPVDEDDPNGPQLLVIEKS